MIPQNKTYKTSIISQNSAMGIRRNFTPEEKAKIVIEVRKNDE